MASAPIQADIISDQDDSVSPTVSHEGDENKSRHEAKDSIPRNHNSRPPTNRETTNIESNHLNLGSQTDSGSNLGDDSDVEQQSLRTHDQQSHLRKPRTQDSGALTSRERAEADSSTPNNLQHELDPFDWPGLEKRFTEQMAKIDTKETAIFEEFNTLCTSFGIWAEAMREREQQRSLKRIKTQIAHVQIGEAELEKKRAHYQQVVNAFKNAIRMLSG